MKFRCWDTQTKQYSFDFMKIVVAEDGTEYSFIAFYVDSIIISLYTALHDSRYVVERSIGRFDKHGMEIYEADVLEIASKDVVAVVWDDQVAGFNSEPEIDHCGWGWNETLADHLNRVEVIGSIHDMSLGRL